MMTKTRTGINPKDLPKVNQPEENNTFELPAKSDKPQANTVVDLLEKHGIKQIVCSPGSRNAPLINSFAANVFFKCNVIVDERTASFFALGISISTGIPAVLCCTSGSAPLNYSSAISEAFYQRIPLIVLTADRPIEWINHGEGQAINQENIYSNYILGSFNLVEASTSNQNWHNERMCNEALLLAQDSRGPVHINIPFTEPLYGTAEIHSLTHHPISLSKGRLVPSENQMERLSHEWNEAKSKIIIVGQESIAPDYLRALQLLSEDPSVIVLTETCSNCYHPSFINNIDRTLTQVTDHHRPELLIYLGEQIISKKIKAFLRECPNLKSWRLSNSSQIIDTFQNLSHHLQFDAKIFLTRLSAKTIYDNNSDFQSIWIAASEKAKLLHSEFLQNCEWSDLKAFEIILDSIPENGYVHLSNSSPVRYAQLFEPIANTRYFGNRGVSGIDGCTSTMMGVSSTSECLNILITGDLGFVYDINGLWAKNRPVNFKIIIINNGGGGIFRFIPGPDNSPNLENFFEASNPVDLSFLAKAHGINYALATNSKELETILFQSLSNSDIPEIIEITTPKLVNADVLKRYFAFLRQN